MGNNNKIGAAMVVGGGIGGMQAALDLAKSGIKVYLVEKSPCIGGVMSQLDKTFPTNDCSMCIMAPKLVEVGRHKDIEIITLAEIEHIKGGPGNFNVTLKKRARYINEEKCTGCGECTEKCPVTIPDNYNTGLSDQKAIYRRYPQAIPNYFAIHKLGQSPCRSACPAGQKAQGYIALIREKRYEDAYRVITRDNPFPSVCGRICNHRCEDECTRGKVDEPVAIMFLKRFIADWAFENKIKPDQSGEQKQTAAGGEDKKVAIIGAGPAGLTAAKDLSANGYTVTVFEKLPLAGGMMYAGIPRFRLPLDRLSFDITNILNDRIELKTDCEVKSINTLFQDGYEAVFIATGAHKGKKIPIPGADLPGVLVNTDFLRDVALGKKVTVGKTTVVLGGGNVAMDVARTALRCGAETVKVVCLESREQMPAHSWEIEDAEKEGIEIHPGRSFLEILSSNNKVSGIKCIKVVFRGFHENGRPDMDLITGSEHTFNADTIIFAIGQGPEIPFSDEGIELTPRGTIKIDRNTLATSKQGVFAGGDVVTGTQFVVDAIAAGHKAATSIDRYLRGEDLDQPEIPIITVKLTPEEIEKKITSLKKRHPLPVLSGAGKKDFNEVEIHLPSLQLDFNEVEDHLPSLQLDFNEVEDHLPSLQLDFNEVEDHLPSLQLDFNEVEDGYKEEEALAEAGRCLNCGICSECFLCVETCKADAVNHQMPQETYQDIPVGSIILAPGYEIFDPGKKFEYGYLKYTNVITSLEFERILSATGPYKGHVLRPSDRSVPEKIAFIQCVGSRDSHNDYCSSVCCMYAIKEAVIAKEHEHKVNPTIFYMDVRSYGKEFERYYVRAKDEYGIQFKRARVSDVTGNCSPGGLTVTYEEKTGHIMHEDFDMVILSVGFQGYGRLREIGDKLGMPLNKHGYIASDTFTTVETKVPGIYVCGPAQEPKDIPDTVVQASAAASAALEDLSDCRWKMIKEKTYPPEMELEKGIKRIGVFICHCGINIGGTVNVPEVVEYAKSLPDVIHAEHNLYTCSQDTQSHIKEMIEEYKLNRVIVASCTPRTHEPLFQETIREAGLNRHLFTMANIRDQCSWVHMNLPAQATEKARDLVRMAVSKVRLAEPLPRMLLDVTQKALVIGGGPAGMSSALSLAHQGFPVDLVEKEVLLGGNMNRVLHTIDGKETKGLLRKMIKDIEASPNITVHLQAEIKEVTGFVGNYRTVITRKGKPDNEIEHGVAVIATGAKESIPKEYLFGKDKRVVTGLEFEKLLDQGQEKELPEKVVFIQCVGSREEEYMYCSKICCRETIKNALAFRRKKTQSTVYVLYRDIRAYGFSESYYRQAREAGVIFIQYDVMEKPRVSAKNGELEIHVSDTQMGSSLLIPAQMVVLAARVDPSPGNEMLSQFFKVPLNKDKFYLEAHVKLRPVDFATEGVFLAGMAHSPMTLSESLAQGKAAAARAATIISSDKYESEATIGKVDNEICAGCGLCASICEYNAIEMVALRNGRKIAKLNEIICKGCGSCAAACPSGTMTQKGFTSRQIVSEINAVLDV